MTIKNKIKEPVQIFHVENDPAWDKSTDGYYEHFKNYIIKPTSFDTAFNLIFVDGRARLECLQIGWMLLHTEGLMILHDAQRIEYRPGHPQNGHFLKITNTLINMEGNIQTAFFSKSAKTIALLAQQFQNKFPPHIKIEVDSGTFALLNSDQYMNLLRGVIPNYLYAGDVPNYFEYQRWVGLSLDQGGFRHIRANMIHPLPFPDNSIEGFQAEDVFEHIEYRLLPQVIQDIYRVLKPGCIFRLSVPDYGCDVLRDRSLKDGEGNIIFDPWGGGSPADPGHLWFPRIDSVRALLSHSRFSVDGHLEYLHYWNMDGSTFVVNPIDYGKGLVLRTPDFDPRVRSPYRPMSLVVDLHKN